MTRNDPIDILVSEVGPRDGLQSVSSIMPTAAKKAWVTAAADAGLREIEVGSFVPAKLLPQLADTAEIVAFAKTIPNLTVAALVPNARGAEAAIAAGADKITLPLSVSESHSLANLRRTHEQVIAEARQIGELIRSVAPERRPHFEGSLSTVFGCTLERALIEDSIRTVREATGQTIKGWLAPALTHTPRTLDLIAEYGLSYTCDLYHDDQPGEVHVRQGRLISMPYSLEVNDHYGFFVYNMSPREYANTLIRQYQRLADEGGTVMCIPLHAYLIGQPHRIGAFEEVLKHIAADGRAWITRSGDIADHYTAQVPA